MKQRYFLYLDILGFSDLARNASVRVEDLYEVIASLNVHHHHAFKVVVFSDTVIVYNVDGGDTPRDSSYLIMFLCEFVKDLMHRLTGREIYYRALITYGEFNHYELNGMPCFFGNALVDAYSSEKKLKAVGLFIHKDISNYCDIFEYKSFNDNYNFVYITQALDEVEFFGRSGFPISPEIIESTGSKWFIFPEINHVSSMHKIATNDNYSETIKKKYQASWEMYCKQYPNITDQLLSSNHDVCSISPEVDWNEVFERFPEDCSYAIKSRKNF